MKTWERYWIRIVSRMVSYVAVIAVFFLVMVLGAWLFRATEAVRAQSGPEVTCVEWANLKPWTITRCESDYGEVCFMANSGMMACRFD